MFSSEEYDKRINELMRRAGALPADTDDVNTSTKQMQIAEEALIKREVSAQHIANLANRAIAVMNQYLYIHGIDNLTNLDKATVLKAISDYLGKKAWLILDSKEDDPE